MRTFAYSAAAQRDLIEIARYVATSSGSREAGRRIYAELDGACAKLAATSVVLGRGREEFRPGLRSVPHKRYVIFFAYPNAESVAIVRILHGARDLDAVFRAEDS